MRTPHRLQKAKPTVHVVRPLHGLMRGFQIYRATAPKPIESGGILQHVATVIYAISVYIQRIIPHAHALACAVFQQICGVLRICRGHDGLIMSSLYQDVCVREIFQMQINMAFQHLQAV